MIFLPKITSKVPLPPSVSFSRSAFTCQTLAFCSHPILVLDRERIQSPLLQQSSDRIVNVPFTRSLFSDSSQFLLSMTSIQFKRLVLQGAQLIPCAKNDTPFFDSIKLLIIELQLTGVSISYTVRDPTTVSLQLSDSN
ncbi:hypothetical protein [Nocardia sp. R6R-6]|uniref:hypothetical protein n=1 Tax=Nocardia sp. R6R-6 TaxID=3459303 RepID=UPI00403DD31B